LKAAVKVDCHPAFRVVETLRHHPAFSRKRRYTGIASRFLESFDHHLNILPAASGENSYGLSVCFPEMASVGSSATALLQGEDHEEALLLGCPPIGRSDRDIERFGRKRKRGLISSP